MQKITAFLRRLGFFKPSTLQHEFDGDVFNIPIKRRMSNADKATMRVAGQSDDLSPEEKLQQVARLAGTEH